MVAKHQEFAKENVDAEIESMHQIISANKILLQKVLDRIRRHKKTMNEDIFAEAKNKTKQKKLNVE